MLDAHVRDSVALIDMAARLEDGMAAGEHWDELKVMKELTNRRKLQKYYKVCKAVITRENILTVSMILSL